MALKIITKWDNSFLFFLKKMPLVVFAILYSKTFGNQYFKDGCLQCVL